MIPPSLLASGAIAEGTSMDLEHYTSDSMKLTLGLEYIERKIISHLSMVRPLITRGR